MPEPYTASKPAGPRSRVLLMRRLLIVAWLALGLAARMRKATPATSGAENDVPDPAPYVEARIVVAMPRAGFSLRSEERRVGKEGRRRGGGWGSATRGE